MYDEVNIVPKETLKKLNEVLEENKKEVSNMPQKGKKYITTWSGGFYVKVDEQYYRQYPENRLVAKTDIQNVYDETNDLEWAIYSVCCRGCEHEKWCHEACEQRCRDDEDNEIDKLEAFAEEGDI